MHELVVCSYYVAPLIARMLPKHALAYSATIRSPDRLACETGIVSALNDGRFGTGG